MSTKTTFKRVALVTVAALGFGVLTSVAPATAGSNVIAVSMTSSVLTTSPTAGSAVKILINYKGFGLAAASGNYPYQVLNAAWNSIPAKSTTTVAAPTLRVATVAEQLALGVTATGGTSGFQKDGTNKLTNAGVFDTSATTAGTYELVYDNAGAGSYSRYAIVEFTPDVAGTWTIQIQDPDRLTYYIYPISVTVAAKAEVSVAASTIALTTAVDGFPTYAADGSTIVGVSGSKTAGKTVGTALVTLANAASSTLLAADAPKITATVTGPGLVSWAGGSQGRSVSSAGSSLTDTLTIFSDGSSGDGKVTFSYTNAAGTSVELGSKTVSFFGSVASIKTTLYHSVVPTGTFVCTGCVSGSRVVRAMGYDKDGTLVKGVALYMTSSSQSVITANVAAATTACSTSSGKCYWATVGAGKGTATLKIVTGADATASGYVSQEVGSVRVGTLTAKTIKIAFDKTLYVPGELATISVTATDADGLSVADGAVTAFASGYGGVVTDNFAFGGTGGADLVLATADAVTIDGGSATFYVNMPQSRGKLTVTGYGAATLAASQALSPVSSQTVEIGNDAATQAAIDAGSAATDAAAEATDAANAATDAANAAAEAADAATAAAQDAADAVAVLSAQVATMIAGLKAQLTALTNLIIKIQKKLKA